jgi:predicted transcriptional regulator
MKQLEPNVFGRRASEDSLSSVFLSSKTRLRLAELMSIRPRSLRELAKLTGLTMPGVLRHLDALNKEGLITANRLSSRLIPVRKTYSLKGVRVIDLSTGDLSITKISKSDQRKGGSEKASLEWLASDVLVSRRRIREKSRRLARAIDEHLESESKLTRAIDALDLEDDERLIVLTAYTEETTNDAMEILESEGMRDVRKSIDSALAKAKRIATK